MPGEIAQGITRGNLQPQPFLIYPSRRGVAVIDRVDIRIPRAGLNANETQAVAVDQRIGYGGGFPEEGAEDHHPLEVVARLTGHGEAVGDENGLPREPEPAQQQAGHRQDLHGVSTK